MKYHSDMGGKTVQSVKKDISKCKNCTLDELVLLKIIKQDPTMTQKELAGKRNGRWEVLCELTQ